MEKTNLIFEFENKEQTSILVKRKDGEVIGRIWAQGKDGGFPYPHSSDEYCKNSIQICGFDKISEVWACGPFQGKKDCVVHFIDMKSDYREAKLKKYENYVKEFMYHKKPIHTLQNFNDWDLHNI